MKARTIADVATAVDGRVTGDAARTVSGVAVDSRSVRPGDLFVALSGDSVDGHAFVGRALDAGAGGALVSRDWASSAGATAPGGSEALIAVADTRQALLDLAGDGVDRQDVHEGLRGGDPRAEVQDGRQRRIVQQRGRAAADDPVGGRGHRGHGV